MKPSIWLHSVAAVSGVLTLTTGLAGIWTSGDLSTRWGYTSLTFGALAFVTLILGALFRIEEL
jgi:hypothetical protein